MARFKISSCHNKNQTKKVKDSIIEIVPKGLVKPYITMGGEDFSYNLQKKPGCFLFLGSSPNKTKKINTPHHCSHFDINENSLILGASVFVKLIERQLLN